MEPDEKKCPYCAETIKAEAIKCKHCWSMLGPEEEKEAEEPSQRPEPASEEATPSPDEPTQAKLGKIGRDVEINGKVAFKKDELVEVETIEVDGEQRYEATSTVLDGVYELSEEDVNVGSNSLRNCDKCGKEFWGSTDQCPACKDKKRDYKSGLSGIKKGLNEDKSVQVVIGFVAGIAILIGLIVLIIKYPVTLIVLGVIIGLGLGIASGLSKGAAGSTGAAGKPARVCPTCGSSRVERFSRTWKVTKVATVGVFGLGNVHKIFKCKDCGYKW